MYDLPAVALAAADGDGRIRTLFETVLGVAQHKTAAMGDRLHAAAELATGQKVAAVAASAAALAGGGTAIDEFANHRVSPRPQAAQSAPATDEPGGRAATRTRTSRDAAGGAGTAPAKLRARPGVRPGSGVSARPREARARTHRARSRRALARRRLSRRRRKRRIRAITERLRPLHIGQRRFPIASPAPEQKEIQ